MKKISQFIAELEELNKRTPYKIYCCPLCEEHPNYVTSKSLKAHLALRHENEFEPEEQPDKEVNYLGIFAVVGNCLQQKSNGLIYAEKVNPGWSCRMCPHYEQTQYGILKHCYEHWQYYKQYYNEKSDPESDGQAEQHLGSVTSEYWDEVAEWTPEAAKKWRDWIAQHPNKVKCAKWALGEWGKDAKSSVTEVWWDEMTQTVRECKPNCNKYDNGKPRLDLVPPAIIEAVGEIRTYGVGKYGDSESWHTVEPARYRAAMMRHLCAYLRDPKSKDEESGLSHLSHAACNIAFLLELEKEGKV